MQFCFEEGKDTTDAILSQTITSKWSHQNLDTNLVTTLTLLKFGSDFCSLTNFLGLAPNVVQRPVIRSSMIFLKQHKNMMQTMLLKCSRLKLW